MKHFLEHSDQKKLIIYTDGSTNARQGKPNSGCGIVVTSTDHKLLWKGGMPLRSDGNNFTAELAAAACSIKAVPKDR